MISSIRHKGLALFYETGSKSGIQADHASKLRMILTAMIAAKSIKDIDKPGYRLHRLKGVMKNQWSVTVNGNCRLTFEFNDGNVELLDYKDYH